MISVQQTTSFRITTAVTGPIYKDHPSTYGVWWERTRLRSTIQLLNISDDLLDMAPGWIND